MTQNRTSALMASLLKATDYSGGYVFEGRLTIDREDVLAVAQKYRKMEEKLWKILQEDDRDEMLVLAHEALAFDPLFPQQ